MRKMNANLMRSPCPGEDAKYDVFVKVSAENPDAMELTVAQIRKIKMLSSHTLPVVYGQGGTIDNETN